MLASGAPHHRRDRERERGIGTGRVNVKVNAPPAVHQLIATLEGEDFETWAVGGAIRDALLGEPGGDGDWDLATRATPRQIQRLFRRTVPLGIRYGTVGVFGPDDILYEVTTFRHDVITYGRKAVVAFATSLEEDLARRDFTVNAIAWHPERELFDPYGGAEDLEHRLLRTVGDPAERFREDYLRVLRGLRFAGTFEMEIHPDTWKGMVDAVPGLARLSMERVREELLRVLASAVPSRALELYERCGARALILPELQQGIGPSALATIDAVRGRRTKESRSVAAEVRLAVLLLFGAGLEADPTMVADTLTRLRFSKSETERVQAAISGGLGPGAGLLNDPVARRRWHASLGRWRAHDVLRIWFAALRAGTSPAGRAEVFRLIAQARSDLRNGVPMSLADLAVAGRDLLEKGWAPGPEIGRTLGRLLEAVWRDPGLNDRAALLELAAEEGPVR
ncbi:MAG: hypothetical protein F4Y07_03450 [Gemmatimonadetes bacterium]|nr:hypothetical protein [Gemmatimonadota bacterium]MYE15517.1 hypothetical protein [Gemmatimonadota bacterium]MYG20868.1 hypothetical protein [Gemmatimonadota bacterium]MYJ39997.1 hypothetical protein [Gemmatimonadota bacterium]